MGDTIETVDGDVIDIACVRKNASDDLSETAHNHSSRCALVDHRAERGYGVVTEDDRLPLLDPKSTRRVVDAGERSNTRAGIRLRVTREDRDGTMDTIAIEGV